MKRAYKTTYRTTYKTAHLGSKLNYSSAEVDTYIEGLTTPLSSGQETKLRTFVVDLKKGLGIKNLSDAFDVMYILAGETAESSLRNIVKRAHDATAINSPAFTALEGFKGNGTSAYINTNYIPKTDNVNYQLNNGSMGVYVFSNFGEINSDFLAGTYSTEADGGTSRALRIANYHGDIYYLSINCAVGGEESMEYVTQQTLYTLSRIESAEQNTYMNENKYTYNSVSTGIPNQNLLLLSRMSSGGQAGLFTFAKISFAFVGKGLSDADNEVIRVAIQNYLT